MKKARIGDLTYRLKSTGKNSEHFGLCEVCDKHVPEVFIQSAKRCYRFDNEGQPRWTGKNAPETLFGHEQCLKSEQW